MADFINMTLGDWMDKQARDYHDHEALVYVDRGIRLTYKQLNDVARRAAKSLLRIGVKKDTKVAIWATNYPEWLYLLFATAKIGAILVTVNTNYKIFELEYLLRQSDSHTMMFINGLKTTNYVEIINELVPEIAEGGTSIGFKTERLPYMRNIVYLQHDEGEPVPENFTSWNEFISMGDDIPDSVLDELQASLDCHDVINMQYTSGTTGFPKGVMLTHYNIINNGFYIGENMKITSIDRMCIPVPFFHCFGLVLAVMAAITHGATMLPVDYYSPTAVMNVIEKERCTSLHGVPTMYIFILEHKDFEKYDFSSLRTGIMSGTTCPIKLMQQAIELMNMREITICYGLTEGSPVLTQTTADESIERRVTTIGRALPHIQVKCVDPETGIEVPDGVIGEICCKGYNIMKGYYKMEEATRNAIDENGWLHTGDLGVRDSDGYFKITGRIKDMIIRGGENIYPREIEELYYLHPAVQDVQIVGVPSRKFGEEVMAYIILKENMTATEEEMKEYVFKNMSRHKVPSYVAFVDSFPMTASGKIQKYRLREMAVELLNLQDEASVVTV